MTRGVVLTFALVAAVFTATPAQAHERHLTRAEAIQTVVWLGDGLVLPGNAPLADCRRVRANVRRCSFVGESYRVRVRETRTGYFVVPVGVPALDLSF